MKYEEIVSKLRSGSAEIVYAAPEVLIEILGQHKPSHLRARVARTASKAVRTGDCAYCGTYPFIGDVMDYLNGSKRRVHQHLHEDPAPPCGSCHSTTYYEAYEEWPCRTAKIIAKSVGVEL